MYQSVTRTREALPVGKRFVVNLNLDAPGAPALVRSCEITGGNYRNRTSFQDLMTIDDVFEERVAEGLRYCLSQLSVETKVLHLPEFCIETSNLLLGSANIMVSRAEAGDLAVILRFSLLVGSGGAAFRPEFSPPEQAVESQHQLAALVLSDISLPLLDLCTAAEIGTIEEQSPLGDFMRRLVERSDEIRFQVELVKRYVDGLDRFPKAKSRPKALDDPHCEGRAGRSALQIAAPRN